MNELLIVFYLVNEEIVCVLVVKIIYLVLLLHDLNESSAPNKSEEKIVEIVCCLTLAFLYWRVPSLFLPLIVVCVW